MTLSQALALLAASAAAGVMNAMAGGGTIVTYPTLLLAGVPAIVANATSTVALLPGTMASMAGYRREVASHRHWLKTLFLPSLLGGTLGAVLLLRTPERLFAELAPALILFATLLFMAQGLARRRAAAASGDRAAEERAAPVLSPARWALATLCQLGVAIYGGYFGAGAGILMLAILGFLGLSNIHAMNGLKNFFGLAINLTAAVYFIARGAVAWPPALVMIAGAIAGGYGGARFAQRIGQERARAAVVAIGLLMTALLFWQRSG